MAQSYGEPCLRRSTDETDAISDLPNGTLVRIVPKDMGNFAWAVRNANMTLSVSDIPWEQESFVVVSPGLHGNRTISLKPLSSSRPNDYVMSSMGRLRIKAHGGHFKVTSWIVHKKRDGFVSFESLRHPGTLIRGTASCLLSAMS